MPIYFRLNRLMKPHNTESNCVLWLYYEAYYLYYSIKKSQHCQNNVFLRNRRIFANNKNETILFSICLHRT